MEDQKTKANALVAELQNNPNVTEAVKTTITALATLLSSLSGSFGSLSSLTGRKQRGKRDTSSGKILVI